VKVVEGMGNGCGGDEGAEEEFERTDLDIARNFDIDIME
jgi:hypothetical protein